MNEQGLALKKIRGEQKKSEFCAAFDMPPSQYHRIESGELNFPEKYLPKFKDEFGENDAMLLKQAMVKDYWNKLAPI